MLSIFFDDEHDAFVLTPRDRLSEDDFAELSRRVDAYIEAHNMAPALIIYAPSFLGWATFSALLKHAQFVRQHHTLVPKVAVVSDSAALTMLPPLADHFVSAQVRHFSGGALEAAKTWVSEPDALPGTIVWVGGLPDDVVAFRATGTITARDYQDTLIPAIEEGLKKHDHLKLLYHLGSEFAGCTAGAVWNDAKFGLLHLTDFARIAVVSDIDWVRHATKLFAPLLPGRVHVFGNDELDAAKQWITAET